MQSKPPNPSAESSELGMITQPKIHSKKPLKKLMGLEVTLSQKNHGSVENGCISNISFLSFRVIFHWTMIMRERVEDLEDKRFLLGPVVTFQGWSALKLRGGQAVYEWDDPCLIGLYRLVDWGLSNYPISPTKSWGCNGALGNTPKSRMNSW